MKEGGKGVSGLLQQDTAHQQETPALLRPDDVAQERLYHWLTTTFPQAMGASLFGGTAATLQVLHDVAQMNGPLRDASDYPANDPQHNAEQHSAKAQRDPDHPQRDPDKDPGHLP
jgi:hypothetical protein